MRDLIRNQTKITYLNYVKDEKVKDSEGYFTGETTVVYTKPKMFMGHISGAMGSSLVEVFGTDVKYDKTITIVKEKFEKTGINENSVFFIGKKPTYQENMPLYNYRVVRIAETINQVVIAIKKVGN